MGCCAWSFVAPAGAQVHLKHVPATINPLWRRAFFSDTRELPDVSAGATY